VPEGVNGGRLDIITRSSSRIADIFITKGDAEAADDQARDARDDGESYSLLQGVGLGHEDEFTFVTVHCGVARMFTDSPRGYSQT